MQLAVFNGSPRGMKSNTRLLMEQMLAGYANAGGEADISIHYLAKTTQIVEQVAAYETADLVILAFPLYTDSMPGITKAFIEALAPVQKQSGFKIGFLVQSGFPEAEHSVHVEAYLEKLTDRLDAEYIGTIIKGGVEGIQVQPEQMTRKLFESMQEFGKDLAETGTWDPDRIMMLRHPQRLSRLNAFLLQLVSYTGLTNYYWNQNLKKHNAFERRFDRPYQPSENG
jgi:NAD(P)H-dependent FMN reductase